MIDPLHGWPKSPGRFGYAFWLSYRLSLESKIYNDRPGRTKVERPIAEMHVETQFIAGKRLGLRPPSNRPALLFRDIRTGVIPEHPLVVDYLKAVTNWAMLGNDSYGDCGPVSVANLRALVSKFLVGVEQYPTLDDVLDLYRRSGNPNFPVDDNGVDMQQMLGEVHKNGIAGNKCVAYAKVDINNLDEVRAAIAIFGGLLLGVDLDIAQQSQTDTTKVWDYVRGSGLWGGHAVLASSYTSLTGSGQADLGLVSWAEILGLTDAFWDHQAGEAWVVIWPEHLGTTQFMQGIDLNKLSQYYTQVTNGQVLPLPTPPSPAPTPTPVPPAPSPQPPGDLVTELIRLWKELGHWLKAHGFIN